MTSKRGAFQNMPSADAIMQDVHVSLVVCHIASSPFSNLDTTSKTKRPWRSDVRSRGSSQFLFLLLGRRHVEPRKVLQ